MHVLQTCQLTCQIRRLSYMYMCANLAALRVPGHSHQVKRTHLVFEFAAGVTETEAFEVDKSLNQVGPPWTDAALSSPISRKITTLSVGTPAPQDHLPVRCIHGKGSWTIR